MLWELYHSQKFKKLYHSAIVLALLTLLRAKQMHGCSVHAASSEVPLAKVSRDRVPFIMQAHVQVSEV